MSLKETSNIKSATSCSTHLQLKYRNMKPYWLYRPAYVKQLRKNPLEWEKFCCRQIAVIQKWRKKQAVRHDSYQKFNKRQMGKPQDISSHMTEDLLYKTATVDQATQTESCGKSLLKETLVALGLPSNTVPVNKENCQLSPSSPRNTLTASNLIGASPLALVLTSNQQIGFSKNKSNELKDIPKPQRVSLRPIKPKVFSSEEEIPNCFKIRKTSHKLQHEFISNSTKIAKDNFKIHQTVNTSDNVKRDAEGSKQSAKGKSSTIVKSKPEIVTTSPELKLETAFEDKKNSCINDVLQFKCVFCGIAFTTRKDLKTHKKSHKGTNRYFCGTCGDHFSSLKNLSQHKLKHGELQPFKCKYCPLSFQKHSELVNHKKNHTTEEMLFKCSICDKSFSRIFHLERHQITHTGERPFKCDMCGKGYTSRYYLEKHKALHLEDQTEVKRPEVSCEVCGETFSRNTELTMHKRKANHLAGLLKCEICQEMFSGVISLSRHHKEKHTDCRDHICEICGKTFSRAAYLTVHAKTHSDTREKQFVCDICGKAYHTKVTLKYHRRKHTGERPHKCNICGQAFSWESSLAKHQTVHTGIKPFICDVCGLTFARKSYLKSHATKHISVPNYQKRSKPYSCELCSKCFNHPTALEVHKRKHTGERPYRCEICGKAFMQKGNLNLHSRLHTGEKPYKCEDCGKSFARKGNFNDHRRRHTGQKPYRCDICFAEFTFRPQLKRHEKKHHDTKGSVAPTKVIVTKKEPKKDTVGVKSNNFSDLIDYTIIRQTSSEIQLEKPRNDLQPSAYNDLSNVTGYLSTLLSNQNDRDLSQEGQTVYDIKQVEATNFYENIPDNGLGSAVQLVCFELNEQGNEPIA